jgi:hypothetical protein
LARLGNDYINEIPTQAFIYRDLYRKNTFPIGYINPVGSRQVTLSSSNVTNNGDGSYTLTWTAPEGVYKYQIKLSDQPMVENLNFDEQERTYQYLPNIYDNFWAVLNVDDEPMPAAKGEVQTYTINVEEKINAYNQRYNLLSDDPAYIEYDPNKTYYFAIKYWTTSEATALLGDLTGDGEVNIRDIQTCVNHILGRQDWGAAADVNGDNKVNATDIQCLVNIVLCGSCSGCSSH